LAKELLPRNRLDCQPAAVVCLLLAVNSPLRLRPKGLYQHLLRLFRVFLANK
jgi:hypothetical protein